MQEATHKRRADSGKNAKAKGRLQMVLIFAIPAFAICLSYLMYFTGAFVPEGKTNKGQLILPPKSLAQMNLIHEGRLFSEKNLEGRWGIIVLGSKDCASKSCQDAMYQTRQAHIALGKETDRVVRTFVADEELAVTRGFQQEHPDIVWLKADKAGLLKELDLKEWSTGRYFIVDPLGNIMMGYDSAQHGGDLLKDLKRLLKASKIG
ncbi:hypothetical protein GZ77_22450 [Endozoicomonas montiporae]|uniref:Thioredoxin domain-containing protein n=2 Tax=Endozoicomonas montiporae TaxID=1027273 RepID=A0A081N0B1_9GAMM|nr:hypothetical protein [Endozoicomonas montiporae]AMO54337.1 hypothetical protein EZMO1_0064 [Endozoicomonas montiporae CL-33]KEQ11884.1 hypothetical protein GZ77_22450 [Endozoicomonas montiporae]